MKHLLLIGLSALLLSCSTLSPYVVTSRDPFTDVRTRIMYVGPSQSWRALEEMRILSTYSNPYAYLYPARKPADLPVNHLMTLSVSEGDTLLNFVRVDPERGFDVPSNALLQLKLVDGNPNSSIVNLPLLKPYHTTGGSLIVSARVNASAVRALSAGQIETIRVNRVSTNESDFLPLDWYPAKAYGQAFQKGTAQLLTSQVTKSTRTTVAKEPKKKMKWGWQK